MIPRHKRRVKKKVLGPPDYARMEPANLFAGGTSWTSDRDGYVAVMFNLRQGAWYTGDGYCTVHDNVFDGNSNWYSESITPVKVGDVVTAIAVSPKYHNPGSPTCRFIPAMVVEE